MTIRIEITFGGDFWLNWTERSQERVFLFLACYRELKGEIVCEKGEIVPAPAASTAGAVLSYWF